MLDGMALSQYPFDGHLMETASWNRRHFSNCLSSGTAHCVFLNSGWAAGLRFLRRYGLALLLSYRLFAHAADGDVDTSFNPKVNGAVNCVVMQPDGKRIIGGSFTSVRGSSRNNLARLHADGTLEGSFNPVADGTVNCLTLQPDGRILVGGTFTTLCGQKSYRIARLNGDGTLDMTFDAAASSTVNCIALQADRSIILGGSFVRLTNGTVVTARSRIARLHHDGTVDPAFDPSSGGTVYSIAVQEDGSIVCGGSFTTMGGFGRNRVARLNSDGSLDYFFDPNASGTVYCLAVQADGRLLLGGSFTTIGGEAHYRVARLMSDGSSDAAFAPSFGATVNSMVMQADGKALIGGAFTSATNGGVAFKRDRIARLMPDGSVDPAFDPSASNVVNAVTLQMDGGLLLGGAFPGVGGVVRSNLALLFNSPSTNSLARPHASSVLWTRGGAAPEVSHVSMEIVSNSAWTSLGTPSRVTGALHDWELTSLLGLPAGGFIRALGRVSCGLNSASSGIVEQILSFGAVPNMQVLSAGSLLTNGFSTVDFGPVNYPFTAGNCLTFTLTNAGDSDLILGGASVSGPAASDYTVGTASMNHTVPPRGITTLNVTFNPTTNGTRIATLALASNDGAKLPFVVALAGTGVLVDSSLSPTTDGRVVCVAVQPDGKRVVGGDFSSVGRVSRSHIARFNADGSLDTSFDPRADSTVLSVAVQEDGKILVGGHLTSLQPNGAPSPIPCGTLARLNADGSLDASFSPNVSGSVYSVMVQEDAKILLGGAFNTVAGATRNLIARLNADGTLDTAFDPNITGSSYPLVKCLAVQTDGKILVGGEFTGLQPNGQPGATVTRNRIARLNADGTVDLGFDPQASDDVCSVVIQPDGRILIGGLFYNLRPNGAPTSTTRNKIARLNADGTIDAGFDPNANGDVNCMALQADRKLLLGGSFTSLQPKGATNSITCYRIARLNTDGTLDTSFYPAANGSVGCVEVQSDGRILVGGSFSTLGGQASSRLGLLFNQPATNTLNPAGSTQLNWTRGGSALEVLTVSFERLIGFEWTSLGIPTRETSPSPGWQLDGLSLPADGFLRARGHAGARQSIIETVISSGSVPDLQVLQASGTFLINGLSTVDFGSFNYPFVASNTLDFVITNAGTADLHISAVGISGTAAQDYTLNTNGLSESLVPGGATAFSVSFMPSRGGFRIATLQLISNDGTKLPYSIVLNGLGVLVEPIFHPNISGGVSCAVVQPDRKCIVAGNFNMIAGTSRNYIARLNADGTLDSTFNVSASDVVRTVALQADGKILIGGWFQSLRATGASVYTKRMFLARLNPDGSLDMAFDPSPGGHVYNIALTADEKILLGGEFSSVAGTPRNRVARLNSDGSLDTLFDPNVSGLYVTALAEQPDGRILLGGEFSALQPNGAAIATPRYYVARLNADGSLDLTFDPRPNLGVNGVALQPDGKILLGGHFTAFQPNGATTPTTRNCIARLNIDGTLDADFQVAADKDIMSFAIQTDGKMLLGGFFSRLTNGLAATTRNDCARLDSDGSLDASFNPDFDGDVNSVALRADGYILMGGGFSSVCGLPQNRLALFFNDPAMSQVVLPTSGQVVWMRGGSAPEIAQASFELSTDGGNSWTVLGSPKRQGTSPNWELSGLSLPASGSIRARGHTSGGCFNAGTGLIEETTSFNFLNTPALAIRSTTSNSVILSWPSPSTGYSLQQATSFAPPGWSLVASNPNDDGTNKTISIAPAAETLFFRLVSESLSGN